MKKTKKKKAKRLKKKGLAISKNSSSTYKKNIRILIKTQRKKHSFSHF
jgi:hypothetical protein